jgi:hypothetical protein
MNLHRAADKMIGWIGGLYGDSKKFFRDGTQSPHISSVIEDTEVELGLPTSLDVELQEGHEYEATASFRNNQATSRFTVLQWRTLAEPALIYHHGSGETDYTARIRRIVARMDRCTGNVIAVSVPYNHSLEEYLFGGARLDRWAFMLAASVRLTEQLVECVRVGGCTKIVCSGVSLGGWITNLHHTYFDTCSAYTPIFAGAALDHLFTDTIYRKLLASSAHDADDDIRQALNFEEDFRARGNDDVFPLMARHDQFIRLERQSTVFRSDQMRVLDRGHTTGALAYKQLAAHLIPHIGEETTTEETP